jgi:uncharacterized membrane protein
MYARWMFGLVAVVTAFACDIVVCSGCILFLVLHEMGSVP